jgi:hypothetical protein
VPASKTTVPASTTTTPASRTSVPAPTPTAPTPTTLPRATAVEIYHPWTAAGTLGPGIQVLGHITGGSCFTGSVADASVADPDDENAWRCSADQVGQNVGPTDPCFAPPGKTNVTELACASTPSSGVYLLTLAQPLKSSSTGFKPTGVWPWLLVLSNGDQCEIIQGTASAPGYLNYGCNVGTASNPSTTSQPWTVSYLPNGAQTKVTVDVATVWE